MATHTGGSAGGRATPDPPWTERHLVSYGVPVSIRTNVPELIDLMCGRLPAAMATGRPKRNALRFALTRRRDDATRGVVHEVWSGAVSLGRWPQQTEALDVFERELALSIAASASHWLFVHAGVVEWGGRAIVLPGRSYSGKTTLVAELVRAGATYYSDEYAVVGGDGRVRPFPRPLAVRTPEGDRLRCPPEAFDGRAGEQPVPVGLVGALRYRPGAAWAPRIVTRGEGVLALFGNTVPARTRPADALTVLARSVASAVVLQGSRGEACDVAADLLARAVQR